MNILNICLRKSAKILIFYAHIESTTNSFSARQFNFSLIHSFFMHGIQVYFNICPGTLTNDLFLQHKTALRKVANTHYNPCHLIPIADLCGPLKILQVRSLFKDFNSVYAYDILQKNSLLLIT